MIVDRPTISRPKPLLRRKPLSIPYTTSEQKTFSYSVNTKHVEETHLYIGRTDLPHIQYHLKPNV